jgi:glycosyltransferase involved in cell wall biosynthesis
VANLTAIIMTKNESKNIGACLDSIKNLVERMVVIDSGSDDDTVEIAKRYGADVYFHDFEYYAKQFNWGLDNTNIRTKWVIRLDADERFTQELCEEIEYNTKAHENTNVSGFTIEAFYFFMGRCLKYGSGRKRKLMIFKYGLGRIEDRKRDAHTILLEGKSVALKEKFLHHDFNDLNSFILKYNWYATREAQDYLEYKNGKANEETFDEKIQKRRQKKFNIYYKAPMFLRAWLWFIYNYIFRLGFLDGKEGYIFHVMAMFWYRYLVDAKIYEYETKGKKIDQLRSL